MNPLLDVYASIDGFVHRNVDRVGKRLDEHGDRMRANAGLATMIGASMGFASTAFSDHGPVGPLDIALVLGMVVGSINYEQHNASIEREVGPGVYPSIANATGDRFLRVVRAGQMAIGAAYVANGIASVVNGAPASHGAGDAMFGAWIMSPAISSYLRDRDPPAFEEDPLREYVMKKASRPALGSGN